VERPAGFGIERSALERNAARAVEPRVDLRQVARSGLRDPQHWEDMLVEVDHPTFGNHVRLRPYVSFSRSATVAEPGVLAAQHTDGILSELGYSVEAIADLRERKVLA
jgi:crotonobetainyl-CoA:carnitine CoA-transferase CaiB-like acyl-CoA transferase